MLPSKSLIYDDRQPHVAEGQSQGKFKFGLTRKYSGDDRICRKLDRQGIRKKKLNIAFHGTQ